MSDKNIDAFLFSVRSVTRYSPCVSRSVHSVEMIERRLHWRLKPLKHPKISNALILHVVIVHILRYCLCGWKYYALKITLFYSLSIFVDVSVVRWMCTVTTCSLKERDGNVWMCCRGFDGSEGVSPSLHWTCWTVCTGWVCATFFPWSREFVIMWWGEVNRELLTSSYVGPHFPFSTGSKELWCCGRPEVLPVIRFGSIVFLKWCTCDVDIMPWNSYRLVTGVELLQWVCMRIIVESIFGICVVPSEGQVKCMEVIPVRQKIFVTTLLFIGRLKV